MKTASSRNGLSRRRFLRGTLLASAVATSPVILRSFGAGQTSAAPAEFKRKLKLGVIGCGTRGKWIARLFQKHGGYELHAVAEPARFIAGLGGELATLFTLGIAAQRRERCRSDDADRESEAEACA